MTCSGVVLTSQGLSQGESHSAEGETPLNVEIVIEHFYKSQ